MDSAANSKTKIGLIGLGLMGQPIGMNLLKQGSVMEFDLGAMILKLTSVDRVRRQ